MTDKKIIPLIFFLLAGVLQANPLYFRHMPVAPNEKLCTVGMAAPVTVTGIIELIVTGFTPSQGSQNCTLNTTGSGSSNYCEFSAGNGVITTFRVQADNTPSQSRVFGMKVDYAEEHFEAQLNDESSPTFVFNCGQTASLPCSADEVEIRVGSNLIAVFTVAWPAASASNAKLYCTYLHNDYEIVRLSSSGFQSEEVPATEQVKTFPSTDIQYALSTTPNPFTDHLDVRLGLTATNETVQIGLYDLNGRLVLSKTTTGGSPMETLFTSDLLPGLYFLRTETGGITTVVKVMKTQ